MLQRDKIVFLKDLTVFETCKWTSLTRWLYKTFVTKKPTTQKIKFSIQYFFSKLIKYTRKCGFCHIY